MALLAMMLHVLFGAAHSAAMAAASMGPLVIGDAPTASFGLLQICTANGMIEIRSEDGREGPSGQDGTATDRCPVCGSASVAPAIGAAAVTLLPVTIVPAAFPLPPQYHSVSGMVQSHASIRAPPVYNLI
ncbi:MAG: hypothetical protein C0605_04665 [Hyphomicrobiales bacterium]|nr:MAG: hypothetical protein C0605_04665 [Hyphomicrobiales bacterium]